MSFKEWWYSSDREYYFDWEPEHGYCHEKDLAEAAWNTARTMTPVSERLPDNYDTCIVTDGKHYAESVYHWMPEPEIPR